MAKKFHAEHKETGERWKPDLNTYTHQYLVLYDSGKLAVVSENFYTHIQPLSNEWKLVKHKNWSNL